MTWFLLVFIGVVLFTTIREKKDFFHPIRIYTLLYSLLFAIYFLRLSRFQEPWSTTTMMLFWGAVISFIGGGALVSFYTNKIAPVPATDLSVGTVAGRLEREVRNIRWGRFLLVTFGLFCLFVASYVQSYLKYRMIPMFSSDPNANRFLFLTGNFFTDIAGGCGPLVMMLCAEVILVRKGATRLQRALAAVMLLLSFALYFTLVTRMPLVRAGIYIVVLYHYLYKPISFRLIIGATVLAVLFFAFGAIVRINYSGFSELAQNLRIHLPQKYILLTNPYAYAVNNIWNLDFAFKKFIDGNFAYNHSLGFDTFRPIFYFFRVDGILQAAYNFDSGYNESIVKVTGLNSVFYMWHFYKDFGPIGVFALSLILGIGLHIYYYNTLLSPTPYRVAMYGLFISMIAFSFMIPLWSFWNIYLEMGILTITHKTLRIV